MFNLTMSESTAAETTLVGISDGERTRESALRERFASFWGSATGDMRSVYDTFISACPMVDGVVIHEVDAEGVNGWWLRLVTAKPGAAILYLHGGGYVLGSAKAYRGFVSQLVSRTQVPALVIDYPLAPEATLPSAPAAALAAWKWLTDQGLERISIVGDSAGGGLTLVTLAELKKQSQGASPVAGVVFSPWTDMTFAGPSMTDATVEDPLISYDYLQDCAQKCLGSVSASDPLASPLLGDLHGLPPLLIQVGTDERLLAYADRAAQAGVSVQFEIWEGMHHVFQLDVAHLESSRRALDNAARFLSDTFEPK